MTRGLSKNQTKVLDSRKAKVKDLKKVGKYFKIDEFTSICSKRRKKL